MEVDSGCVHRESLQEKRILIACLSHEIGLPHKGFAVPVQIAIEHPLPKMITKKINENIQVLYLARLAPRSSSFKESGVGKASTNQILSTLSDVDIASINNVHVDVDVMVSIPFAMVDEIADASPSAEDGLLLGDQIVKFGSVEAGDNSEAQSNNGHAIIVVLIRQGTLVNLIVRPRTWQGRGLLGIFRILLIIINLYKINFYFVTIISLTIDHNFQCYINLNY
ncbi:hypothetical protein UlMin_027106 [Ulmus minor]